MSKRIPVLGLDNDGSAVAAVARHEFDFRDDGMTHYVNGEKRAEVDGPHVNDYCDSCPEAGEARARMFRDAQIAAQVSGFQTS